MSVESTLSRRIRRYCKLILVKYKPPSKTLHFIMEYTTLSHIGPSQVLDPIQENAVDHGIHDVIAYRPSSGMSRYPRESNFSWNTQRYCILILVKYNSPFKKM